MKRLFAMMLVLSLVIGIIPAMADTIGVNPQQRGHIAYLESEYGKKKTQQILDSYEQPGVDLEDLYKEYIPDEVPKGTTLEIPQPSLGNTPNLHLLKVGDYFHLNGNFYMVGRFVKMGESNMLVAFPCDKDGVPDVGDPRYFYL